MLYGGGIFTYIYQHFTPYINDPKVGRYSICGAPEHGIHPWIRGVLWCGRPSPLGTRIPIPRPSARRATQAAWPVFFFGSAKNETLIRNMAKTIAKLTSSGGIMFSGRSLPYCRLIGRTNANDHPFLRGRASTDPEIGSIKCSSRESSPNREKKKLQSDEHMFLSFWDFWDYYIRNFQLELMFLF